MSYTEQNWFWKKTLLRKLKSIISPNPSRTRMLLLLIGDYNGQSCQFDQIWTHLGNTLLLRKILSGCWSHASLSECWPPNLWGLFQEGCTEDSEWLEHSGNSAGKKKKRPERKAVSAHLHSLLDSEWTVLSPLLLLLREPQPWWPPTPYLALQCRLKARCSPAPV